LENNDNLDIDEKFEHEYEKCLDDNPELKIAYIQNEDEPQV
jgi:hypothetical protein